MDKSSRPDFSYFAIHPPTPTSGSCSFCPVSLSPEGAAVTVDPVVEVTFNMGGSGARARYCQKHWDEFLSHMHATLPLPP